MTWLSREAEALEMWSLLAAEEAAVHSALGLCTHIFYLLPSSCYKAVSNTLLPLGVVLERSY